jgi:uncharacterized protein with von Willebrand factor type A (vWA) domain
VYWRYGKADTLHRVIEGLLRIFRQLLLIFDGDVEEALQYLEEIGDKYKLWREDFGIGDFRRLIEKQGEVAPGKAGQLRLTRKGERALRRQALHEVFQKLQKRGPGDHRLPQSGGSGEATDETRPFAFGDTTDSIDTNRTLHNWLRRTGGGGPPTEEDLEVREREASTACATVLLIDVSHSMTLYGEDRITPAKRIAMPSRSRWSASPTSATAPSTPTRAPD